MIGIIIGVLVVSFCVVFCAGFIALLRMAKQTDISFGIEPSLEQEDNFVIMENAEEMEEE